MILASSIRQAIIDAHKDAIVRFARLVRVEVLKTKRSKDQAAPWWKRITG